MLNSILCLGRQMNGRGERRAVETLMTKENKIWLYKGELVKIFFRELKIKRKITMAIKRHMTEDVYKGIVQANFCAILRTTNKGYGNQKGVQTLYRSKK